MSNSEKPPVGRNHPPKDHQFGPNRPGNRRGRPRGSRNIKDIVQEFAQLKHTVTINGRRLKLKPFELLLERLRAKALQGDIRADKEVERLRDRFTPIVKEGVGYILAPESLTKEEWFRRAEIHSRLLRSRISKSY